MRGLLLKLWHETWPMTALVGVALMAVNALLTFVLPQFQEGIGDVLDQLPFVKTFLGALLGTQLDDGFTARTMQAMFWVHPVVLALVWAHAILFCTRLPAGEIDRGTIDVLLGLPVSRGQVFAAEVLAWVVSGAAIIGMGFVGHRLAAPLMPAEMRPELSRALVVMMNLYCVYLAVGGLALLVSSYSDRRGRAMAGAFALVVASFLLNFVAQIWAPAKRVAFLGLLEYYRPVQILQTGEFPTAHVAVLTAVAAAATLLGGFIFSRRSICTV